MGPIQSKITQSYITWTALKIFVKILAWCGVINHIGPFSKKNSLSGLRAIQVKIRKPYSHDVLIWFDFFEMT